MAYDIPLLLAFEATHPLLLGLACLADISAIAAGMLGGAFVCVECWQPREDSVVPDPWPHL
jgi:hypothetical protein